MYNVLYMKLWKKKMLLRTINHNDHWPYIYVFVCVFETDKKYDEYRYTWIEKLKCEYSFAILDYVHVH